MRPYVICHMCTTIDGKILVKRWGRLSGGVKAGSLFEDTAASFGVNAWIVGTRTMKEFSAKISGRLARAAAPVPGGDYIAQKHVQGYAIGTDAKGALRFRSNQVEGDHIVILVTRQVSEEYLNHLRSVGVSYLVCGSKTIDLAVALVKLRRLLGIRKLMLEGGGTFNGAMLKARLVDEVSQVIVPCIDGGAGVTGIFDIDSARSTKIAARLRLVKHRMLPGGVCWLRYKVRA